MTSNQLKYWENKEKERHNRQSEENERRGQDKSYEGTKYNADTRSRDNKYKVDKEMDAKAVDQALKAAEVSAKLADAIIPF